MLKNNKIVIAAVILAVGVVIAFAAFFLSSRSPGNDPDETTESVTTTPEDGVHYIYNQGLNKGRVEESITYEKGKEISRNEYEYWEDGKLKTITTKVDGKVTDTWNYLYGTNGILAEMVRIYTLEGEDCRDSYKYTEKGELTEISWYTAGEFDGGFRYSYNEKGDTTREEQLDPNGDVISYTEYRFDDKGNTVSAHTFMYGSETAYSLYEYNEKGQLSSISYYNSKDELSKKVVNEYNEEGQRTKMLTYDSAGTLLSHVESLYDEKGFNHRDIFYEDGKPVYRYDYTEDGARVYSAYN